MSATAIATIIASLIAGGTTIGAGLAQKSATDEANALNLGLSKLERSDELKQLAVTNKANRQMLDLSLRQQDFAEKQYADTRADVNTNRLLAAANRYAQWRNDRLAMNQTRLSPLMKAA